MTQATARIGLGCMRLSTDPDRDEARALATLRAALDAGVTLFDTAHAYGLDDADAGHNERLLARAIQASGVDPARLRIVTKCGMRRPGGAWRPDGRASAVGDDARASREALAGLPIDVLLLHAPDPRTPLATSVRALARAAEDGLARSIGLSNVTVAQIEEALGLAPIAAVEVALGAHDDASARGGVVRFCGERGIEVLAHSPLGGPGRAPRLARDRVLAGIAAALGATPAELVLAYLLALHPSIVPLVGARRPETAAALPRPGRLALDEATMARLDARFPSLAALRAGPPRPPPASSREVVLLMGIPGAGKSRAAAEYAARGYLRLNRDQTGGTLRGIARALDERLAAGAEQVVLDNTYMTRASRCDVVLAAHRHGARARCVFFDTKVAEAQVNVVLRMLERYAELQGPEAMARLAKSDPNLVGPGVHFRMLRELEAPSLDEGFAAIDVVPFVRAPRPGADRAGAMIALDAVAHETAGQLELRDDAVMLVAATPSGAPCLLLGWRPAADAAWQESARAIGAELAARTGREVDLGLCDHPAGPPVCWCRPPLPGLWVAFAERHRLDARKSVLVGQGTAHATMARALGLELVRR